MIKLYFSAVKILAQRPTHISAVATVLLTTKTTRERGASDRDKEEDRGGGSRSRRRKRRTADRRNGSEKCRRERSELHKNSSGVLTCCQPRGVSPGRTRGERTSPYTKKETRKEAEKWDEDMPSASDQSKGTETAGRGRLKRQTDRQTKNDTTKNTRTIRGVEILMGSLCGTDGGCVSSVTKNK